MAACWAAAARETPQDDAGAAASESGRRFPRLGACGRAEPGGRQAPRVHRRWGAASSLCSWLNRQLAESHNRSFRKLVTKALRGCGPSTARRQRGAAARRSGSRRLARIRVEGAQSSSDRDASGRSRTRTWLLRRFSGIWYVLPQPLLLGSGPLPSFSLDDAGDGDRSLIWCCGVWSRGSRLRERLPRQVCLELLALALSMGLCNLKQHSFAQDDKNQGNSQGSRHNLCVQNKITKLSHSSEH